MQKKLMAVAVAGIFAAPALVHAQASNVQIYGRITYEYGYVTKMGDGPVAGTTFNAERDKTDVAQTPGGSAVGFRGSEKLGGGLTAWFQCESSADVRGINQNGFCTRNSAIGFKGKWGNLHFGRWDSPMKRAGNMGLAGAKGTGLLGASFVFSGGSGGVNSVNASNRNRWRRRDVGWTYYESPKFSGFQILAAFTPGNDATNAANGAGNTKARTTSLGGVWKQGPFQVGLGWEEHAQFGAEGVGIADADDSGWVLGGAYTFANKVKVAASYLDVEYETGGGTNIDKENWLVGVDWKIAGPHSFHAAFVQAGDSEGSGTIANGVTTIGSDVAPAGASTGADWFSVAYQYGFSKRTSARFGYVQVKPDTNSGYTLGGLSSQINGQKQEALVMYLQHNF